MKADLSRSTFEQRRHFRDVRWQMGRVPIEADVNEYVDIAAHRVETETIDVIGESGAPVHAAAFQIATAAADLPVSQQAAATALGAIAAGDFLLSAGRYYVNGVMCENDVPIKYSSQAAGDLPDAAPMATAGLYLVYVDVWFRHITALDDPSIREVALGGPDTATRQKTVWQVKAVRVGGATATADCGASFAAYDQATAVGTGTMAAEVDPTPDATQPCILPPGGGYRRLENQLYRVEIHAAGPEGAGATFKWSRDNGAIVSGWEATSAPNTIRLTNPPRDDVMGFAVGNWVELTDDDNDLLGLPGVLVDVTKVEGAQLTLGAAVPAGLTRNPKVRRWDGVAETAVIAGNWIPLEDGVRVRFSAGTYRTGDYWMIPARTATADVEWPRPSGAAAFLAPQGIAHRYARLGFVAFDGTTITPTDCRTLFPPLTEIDEGGDLKLHNRHLHGKGVVCGLQVNCIGSDRTLVRVRPGHAIDCSGTDILVESPQRLDVVERAKALGLLDAAGTGDVELTLKADADEQPVFDLRAATPEPTDLAGILRRILEGTLWRDFYDDCLKPIADLLRARLLDEAPDDKAPVSAQKKRLLTTLNLLAQRSVGAQNKRLWLSQEQHEMLAALYGDLVKLAGKSRTFCAIIDDVPEFPKYPFANEAIRTAFVARKVAGVRLIPDTALAIAWSDDALGHIHLFDLESGEMVRDVELKGAAGLAIQDAAVIAIKERPVLVVAAADANQTVLSLLDPKAAEQLDTFVIAGSRLTRLESHTRRPDVLLALEPGRGLHFLEFARLASAPLDRPKWSFGAAGHLAVLNDRVCLTENITGAGGGSTYEALRFGRLRPGNEDSLEDSIRLAALNSTVSVGEDGLALATGQQGLLLHVVVNTPLGKTAKAALVVEAERVKPLALLELPMADDGSATGPVRVASVQRPGRFVYAIAKRNQLLWSSADTLTLPAALTLPAQAEPIAIANVPLQNVPQIVIAANRESMTLTLVPAKIIGAIQVPDAKLSAYRDMLLDAFEGLVRILVQGLKDCLCEHLLVDCPECEPGEVLQLAKVEIEAGRVRHICNFDRQEVLTFPKVKYWLSAVPIIPLVSYLVDRFCCWIIAKPARVGTRPATPLVTPAVALDTLNLVRNGKVQATLEDNFARAKLWSSFVAQSTSTRATVPSPTVPTGVRLTEVVDRDAASASTKLAERGVAVTGVEDYDAAVRRGDRTISAGKLPATIKAGDSVKLYTRGDTVVFYQVVSRKPDAAPPDTPPGGANVDADIADLRGQLVQLRTVQSQDKAARDRDLAELKLAELTLDAEVRKMAAAPSGTTELKATVDSLRQELTALRDSHATELAARDRQLADLRASNEKLASVIDSQTRKLQADIDRIARTRPPG